MRGHSIRLIFALLLFPLSAGAADRQQILSFAGALAADGASLLHADIAFRHGEHAAAHLRYRRLPEKAPDPERQTTLRRRLAWTYLETDRLGEARDVLSQGEAEPDPALESGLAVRF